MKNTTEPTERDKHKTIEIIIRTITFEKKKKFNYIICMRLNGVQANK